MSISPGDCMEMKQPSTRASAFYATVSLIPAGPAPEGAADKAHHNKNGGAQLFHNPWPSWKEADAKAIAAFLLKQYKWSNAWSHSSISSAKIPVLRPSFSQQHFGADTQNIRATWLGHACYLVEFPSGLRALFDPVMTDRCSPMRWMGPKRFTPAPCQIKDIPIVDIVMISHSHYDHLSYPTIKEIQRHHPAAHFFVPLGNEKWFRSSGIQNVTELDWWKSVEFVLSSRPGGLSERHQDSDSSSPHGTITARISCLPSQHASGRSPFDANKTLWGSWAVKSPWPTHCSNSSPEAASVYFAGDTGYRPIPTINAEGETCESTIVCPAFAQIGELYGPFTLGLLPIGAYGPRALSACFHSDPHDAVEIFCDTRCRRALGMHWGTWALGDEDVREPPLKLAEAMAAKGLSEKGIFDVCSIGESILVPVSGVNHTAEVDV